MTSSSGLDMDRLRRFLCLGTDTSSLVVGETQPGRENISTVTKIINDGKGEEVVREIVGCYEEKKFVNKASLTFALAVCFKSTDNKTKQAAASAFSKVCQHPSDLFHFISFVKLMSERQKGWGRSLRTLVSKWYNEKDDMELLRLVTRFKSGCNWSHVDILRLSHIHPSSPAKEIIIRYVMKGLAEAEKLPVEKYPQIIKYLKALESIKSNDDEHEVSCLLEIHKLKKEHVPTKLLNRHLIWLGLRNGLTIHEILDNITKLAEHRIVNNLAFDEGVLDKLLSTEMVKESGISPMEVLAACKRYELGSKKMKWTHESIIVASLHATFSLAVKNNVESTKKRCLIAVKMTNCLPENTVRGTSCLSVSTVAAGIISTFHTVEEKCTSVLFSSSVQPLDIPRSPIFHTVVEALREAVVPQMPVMACDFAAPINWAKMNKKEFDAIIILTDARDSTGTISPMTELQQYRRDMKLPNTKLVICGLKSKKISFADASDAKCLDIAGFDVTVPTVISHFIRNV